MKKVLSLIAIAAATTAFVACGPSKADQEAAEKAKQDSIKMADSLKMVAEQAKADSMKMADSIAMVAEKAKADSTRIADSIAAATKGGKKK